METKTCSQCGLIKSLEKFHQNGRGHRRSACGECYQKNNRVRYAKRTLERLPFEAQQELMAERERRAEFDSIPAKDKNRSYSEWQRVRRHEKLRVLKSAPCVDCEGFFPKDVMDFDHRDPSEKLGPVGNFLYRASEDRLNAEVAKCDLVCSNCHRVRTTRRRQGLPPTLPPPEYHI